MLEKQTVCLRQLAGNRAGEVRLGRWLANDAVSTQEIINHITNNLTDLVVDRHVLGISRYNRN